MKFEKLNRYFEKIEPMHQTERSGEVGDWDVIKYFAKSEIMRPMFIVTYYPIF